MIKDEGIKKLKSKKTKEKMKEKEKQEAKDEKEAEEKGLDEIKIESKKRKEKNQNSEQEENKQTLVETKKAQENTPMEIDTKKSEKETSGKDPSKNLESKIYCTDLSLDDKFFKNWNKDLFLRNVSSIATEENLRALFEQFGEIEKIQIPKNNKPKGIAQVSFKHPISASKALSLNGRELCGKVLSVNFSQIIINPIKKSKPQKQYKIFVGNLPFSASEKQISDLFSVCGTVVSVSIALNDEGKSRGFCFIGFDSKEAVEKAQKITSATLDGRLLNVNIPNPASQDKRGPTFKNFQKK